MKQLFYPSKKFIVRRPSFQYVKHMITEAEFRIIVNSESFQEALYYASPELYDELKKFQENSLSEKDKKRMEATLYKYMQRIHYRCTPFGSFAFCGIGEYSKSTFIPDDTVVKLHYRYDCKFLFDYINHLIKNSDIDFFKILNVCINQTLFSIDSMHYLTVQREDGSVVDIKIQKNELLDYIIDYCRQNVNCSDLIKAILEIFEINSRDVLYYLKNLILNGILISDIQVRTLGEDNFYRLYHRFDIVKPLLLQELYNTLMLLNSDAKFENKRNELESLVKRAHSIGLKVNRNMLVQVDSFTDEKVCIDEYTKRMIIEWFEILSRINEPKGNPLQDFVNRYFNRYEDRRVSVIDALNPITGIGYRRTYSVSSDLLKNILSKEKSGINNVKNKKYELSFIEQLVLNKIIEENNLLVKNINLSPSDFSCDTKFEEDDYALSYTCMFKIVGYNGRGPILSHISFSGASASCLITRFADSLIEINDILKQIAESEQSLWTDTILSEISHLSSPHYGNVQIRPGFRQFEIPYLSYCNVNNPRAIHIDDLEIRIIKGRVILQSIKHNKKVLPCYSSAFNYKNRTSDLYQFLGDIQHQMPARSFTVNFTSLLSLLKHVRRISYKNIIVNAESWMINNFWSKKDSVESMLQFKELHHSLNMSRYLSYNQGDNYFIIDISSEISISEFFKLAKNQKEVVLVEFLPLSNDFDHFNDVIEIIQPFIHEEK